MTFIQRVPIGDKIECNNLLQYDKTYGERKGKAKRNYGGYENTNEISEQKYSLYFWRAH
jgi:hypothetical protein